MDIFRKVPINIPLLGVIKQIQKYAKILKDLCTHKRRLKINERVNMGRNVPALIQPKLVPKIFIAELNISALTQDIPQKGKDPGTFSIPYTIRDSKFENCMLDLGASINVMSTYVYNNLDLSPL